MQEKLAEKDNQLTELKAKIGNVDLGKIISNKGGNSVKLKKSEINWLTMSKLKNWKKQNVESALKQQHSNDLQNKDAIIKYKDEEIARVKDMKQKLSTKMLGESLEQHCEIEFNKLRPTAFQNAYFEKDNDASSGTKGDYIYKETDFEGNEIISIMFEMKNENDQTSTKKKKNEVFFAKLDKDRKQKNCEYAVLVSLLETENEFYN